MEKTYPGQRVNWLRTEGGGGGSGHRANRKSPHPATVLRVGRGSSDLIEATVYGSTRRTWVRRNNLVPDQPLDPKENV